MGQFLNCNAMVYDSPVVERGILCCVVVVSNANGADTPTVRDIVYVLCHITSHHVMSFSRQANVIFDQRLHIT